MCMPAVWELVGVFGSAALKDFICQPNLSEPQSSNRSYIDKQPIPGTLSGARALWHGCTFIVQESSGLLIT